MKTRQQATDFKQKAKRRSWLGRPWLVLACILALHSLSFSLPNSRAQQPEPDLTARAKAVLARMTVEQRVGQLFLVTFVGNDPSPGTDVAKLVRQDLVGGVVFLASNANFFNDSETPRQVAELSNALQSLALSSGAQVPLFVALDHEGDGYPYTRVTQGTTPIPNAMAIGATWDTTNARDVGQIVGRELAAMGVNLLLGPVVDVLNNPRPGGQGDIGTRTFGGDPWWVGQMGRAYVEGVHQGSNGRVATVAKHFPGHGGSDRLPDDEVATVDKSLQELKRIELPPFFAVTRQDGSPEAVTDALMSSHIRYRGFQGNLREFTAPISFDAEGMGAILGLPELAGWRKTGLMVSDSLGVPAVRKYFDPGLSSYPHRRVAKEAFLAGNDLLLLSQFALSGTWADQFNNMRDAIAYFREEYRANPAFAARVDEAVTRILRLKLKLYPSFALEHVQVVPDAAGQVAGQGSAVTQRIANQAITLLYPDAASVPRPPRRGENIVICTDSRPVRECGNDRCPTFQTFSETAVQDALIAIYGPPGTGQIDPEQITSLSFGQLKTFLAAALAGGQFDPGIDQRLREADWIIFAAQDVNPVKGPNSDALKLFLNQGLSLAHDARLVVLAFNAPYHLDTTEVSKLALYLGAYSKTQPFVQAAVRALFGELPPVGKSPVDVEGINYDLLRQLSPDPDQTIPLSLIPHSLSPTSRLGPPPVDIALKAGPILDYNGHSVPDGTEVTFSVEYLDGTAYLPPEIVPSVGGTATVTITLISPGFVRFTVQSGDADRSDRVDLTVEAPPTPTPTLTVTPTATEPPNTATPTPTDTATPAPSPTVPAPLSTSIPTLPRAAMSGAARPVDGADLLLSAGVTAMTVVLGGLVLRPKLRRRTVAVRWGLLAIVAGMAGYVLYALQVLRPESWGILPEVGWVSRAAVAAVVLVAALLPLPLVLGITEVQN